MASIKATLGMNIITVHEDIDLTTAYQTLLKAQTRHAVVLNSKKEISGILSSQDLEKADRSSDLANNYRTYIYESRQKVRDFMSSAIEVVSQECPLPGLSQRMIEEGTSAYLISYQGVIKGVVSSEDLLRVFHQVLVLRPATPTREDKSITVSQQEEIYLKATVGEYLENPADFEG